VDLETCEIQHPLITKLALAVKRIVKDLSVEPYDEINHTGVLRHAVIRVSFSRKELMLILVTRTPELPCRNELIARLDERSAGTGQHWPITLIPTSQT